MKKKISVCLGLFFAALFFRCAILCAAGGGLYIKDGLFYKDGKLLNAHGVNYFNVFLRINAAAVKGKADDLSWKRGLEALAENKIPFIRFSAFPFYPVDWKLYLEDKEAYFSNMDKVVREAERLNMGLIPSIFWVHHTLQDLLKEPVSAIGNENSKTRNFMRTYAREVIVRYKDSPAIWGWEFGNEFALSCDLPGDKTGLPATITKLGMPATRTKRDKLKREDVYSAYIEFAKIAKSLDKSRPVFSGDAIVRSSAYNNKYNNTWDADSMDESEEMLRSDNPDPIDTITIHAYKEAMLAFKWANGISDAFMIAKRVADSEKKPVFVDEWGVPDSMCESENRKDMEEILAAIKAAKIQLSALWVFDLKDHDKGPKWCILPDNNRSIYFEKLRELNGIE